MTRLLLALIFFFCAAVSAADAMQPVDVGSNRIRTGVDDPRAFVAANYARYQANPNQPPPDPSIAYSPRLRALFARYDAWSRQHADLVGALDFDWWTNAQDYELRNVVVTARAQGRNRQWVTARFDNYDRHDEIRFLFVRQSGRWYLDDAVEGTGSGDNGWTLSALLQSREE